MKPKRIARRSSQANAHSVAVRDARSTILLLEQELVRMSDRATAAEARCVDLEREVQRLGDRNETQARRFRVTWCELADAREERRVHRLEASLLQTRSRALGAMCRALLLAMRGPRGPHPRAEAPAPLPSHAQGSA